MKIQHNFNNMEQQSNRNLKYPNVSVPVPDARYATNYVFHPQTPNHDLRNYIFPMGPLVYPPFPYSNFSCTAPNYFNPFSHPCFNPRYGQPNFRVEMGTGPNLCNSQNIRVNMRDTLQKGQLQVINLDSSEEDKKQKNSLVPTDNNGNKLCQKAIQPIQIIQLDENSAEKNINVKVPQIHVNKQQKQEMVETKIQKPEISNNSIAAIQKKQLLQAKNNEALEEIKTKIIRKITKKQIKTLDKQQKYSKQRKKKYNEQEKIKVKGEKQYDKIQKKRSDKLQKQPITQIKKKPQQGQTREIAKYMQSHGQIRHGKQFQSDIPAAKFLNSINFNEWLEDKKRKLLKREVGILTY